MVCELRTLSDRKDVVLHPELARVIVCFLEVAEAHIARTNENLRSLTRYAGRWWSAAIEWGSTRSIWMSTKPCRVDSRRRLGPVLAKIALRGLSAGGIWSRQRCIMLGAMLTRRKFNTSAGRLAVREQVRQLMSKHDDQAVLRALRAAPPDRGGPGTAQERARCQRELLGLGRAPRNSESRTAHRGSKKSSALKLTSWFATRRISLGPTV